MSHCRMRVFRKGLPRRNFRYAPRPCLSGNHTDSRADIHSRTSFYADSHANSNSNSNAYADSNPDSLTNPDAYAYANASLFSFPDIHWQCKYQKVSLSRLLVCV